MADRRTHWPVDKANEWYSRQPRLCGCNFTPSTSANTIEMWQGETLDAETIDRELGWAAETGFNSVRVFLHFLVWQNEGDAFKRRVEEFLAVAAGHGISVMPVLFDDCWGQDMRLGPQPKPVPGVHNSRWVACPGHRMVTERNLWDALEEYVKDVVASFASDERIIVWDLYNEPGNGNDPLADRDVPQLGEKSLSLVQAAFNWAREAGPTQPLTVGLWSSKAEFEKLNEFQLAASDVISFHAYLGVEETRQWIGRLQSSGRPLICTEWMARPHGSRFQTHLPLFAATNVGCYCWGLVAGKTQTYFPWRSPPGAPEPELWFHDVLHADGSPYDPAEVEAIRQHVWS